jgi:hypothetical protein
MYIAAKRREEKKTFLSSIQSEYLQKAAHKKRRSTVEAFAKKLKSSERAGLKGRNCENIGESSEFASPSPIEHGILI